MVPSIIALLPNCISSFSTEENGNDTIMVDARCIFPAAFSGFQGHFPGKPILPAVIQLATIRFIASKAIEHPLSLLEYSRIKFKAMIQPDEEIRIHLDLQKDTPTIQGKFKIFNLDQKTVASGNYVFKKEAAS
jgi:3-hydroxymyristoyl/3-hydroxydecanoyl-(acyl carrier protein) dehydratase